MLIVNEVWLFDVCMTRVNLLEQFSNFFHFTKKLLKNSLKMVLKLSSFFSFFLLFFISIVLCKKASSSPDPRECEVCISNLEIIDSYLTPETRKDKSKVREAIGKRCTKSGFGSEWKPNPELSQKDVKMCYIFEPIKEAITVPFITGMPKEKICKRLKKDNPDICDVKYRKIHLLPPLSLLFLIILISQNLNLTQSHDLYFYPPLFYSFKSRKN